MPKRRVVKVKSKYEIKEIFIENGKDIETIIKEVFKNYVQKKLEKNM